MPDLADSDYDLVPVDQQPQFADQLAPPSALASQVSGFPQRAADLGMAALGPIGEAGMTVGDMMRTGQVDPRDIPQVVGGVMMGVAAPEAEEAAPLEAGAKAIAKGITAYHGSPYDFDKFDLSKIGTGEGAQAFGHGLYFAQNPDTALAYKNSLSDLKPYQVEGTDAELPSWVAKTIASRNPVAIDDMRNTFQGRVADMQHGIDDGTDPQPWVTQGNITGLNKILEGLDAVSQGANLKAPGKMYQVSINADPEHFLDWDKPLSEQSPHVQSAIQKAVGPAQKAYLPPRGEIEPDHSPSQLYDSFGINAAHATDALRQAGIPGIKYLDQGSRNADQFRVQSERLPGGAEGGVHDVIGPGNISYGRFSGYEHGASAYDKARALAEQKNSEGRTSNYVVFDDNLINIVKKYGMAGLIAGGGAHFATVPTNNKPDFGDQHFAKGGSVKSTKAQAHYHGGTKAKRCADCNMFEPPHGCSAVRGSISPHGVCDFFERKSASKAA